MSSRNSLSRKLKNQVVKMTWSKWHLCRVALQCYDDIKDSDWLFQVPRLLLTNQRALIQHSIVTLGTLKNYDIGCSSWSCKQNLSLNLCYTHFRALLLVEILEQPIRMLKNQHSVIWCWKYLHRIGPSSVIVFTWCWRFCFCLCSKSCSCWSSFCWRRLADGMSILKFKILCH